MVLHNKEANMAVGHLSEKANLCVCLYEIVEF